MVGIATCGLRDWDWKGAIHRSFAMYAGGVINTSAEVSWNDSGDVTQLMHRTGAGKEVAAPSR